MTALAHARRILADRELCQRLGRVQRIQGLALEAQGPDVALGELCRIGPDGPQGSRLLAEVVGVHAGRVTLMPHGDLQGVRAGSEVVALGHGSALAAGPHMLGRVVDAFGAPLDGMPPCARTVTSSQHDACSPLDRPRIREVLETGIRVVDALLTLGRGQRVGIFAGSGVGKSTLLGMMARHVQADLNVIALIGERGREVRDFIEGQLGPQGLARSTVFVATSDQPALTRVRAAHAAVDLAHRFALQGRHVLLTMDSVTRLAMARREIGLSAGEPATARGYTPSVFAELPRLCERCGTTSAGGSVTALMTVLVEGDDPQEPIADCLRSLLDGHVVLSRELAELGHFPAIDVLRSTSRLLADLLPAPDKALVAKAIRQLALLERHRPLVDLGAYQAGANPALDAALRAEPRLQGWARQSEGGVPRQRALQDLRQVLGEGGD